MRYASGQTGCLQTFAENSLFYLVFLLTLFLITFSPRAVDIVKCPWSSFFYLRHFNIDYFTLHCITAHAREKHGRSPPGARAPAVVDQYLLPEQTGCTSLLLSIDGTDRRSSNDLVHLIVLWVVTKWSKVNTTATTTAGALMRDATKCRLYTATQWLS